ncbi:hypothetical protein B0H14DRAFT_3502546 [Mycena olivaceomarginata]|nr:hypothetical protein B0H14DRAFT_3502546 [Mycena olivaceomarginata]
MFTIQQAEQVPAWKQMVQEFEVDDRKKNPYEVKITGLTEAEVRLKFAQEEEEAKNGISALHEVMPGSFIMAGLELEEQQQRVRVQAELKKAGMTAMLQATYTPAAIQALAKRVAPAEELAEDTPLMLPSALTPEECENGGCLKGVLKIEDNLRGSSVSHHAALAAEPASYQITTFILQETQFLASRHECPVPYDRHMQREQDTTAFGEIPDGVASAAADCTGGHVEGQKVNERCLRKESEMHDDGLLPELEEDEDDEMVTRRGESMREVSWIWTVAGTAGTDKELEDALRIECAKAWARSRQWTEEVHLLEEEWRRLPLTYAHRERLWIQHVVAVPVRQGLPFPEAEGKVAYATKQAQLFRDLAGRAETTRTEAKLPKGKTYAPTWDPVILSVNDNEGTWPDDDGDALDDDDDAEDGNDR